ERQTARRDEAAREGLHAAGEVFGLEVDDASQLADRAVAGVGDENRTRVTTTGGIAPPVDGHRGGSVEYRDVRIDRAVVFAGRVYHSHPHGIMDEGRAIDVPLLEDVRAGAGDEQSATVERRVRVLP